MNYQYSPEEIGQLNTKIDQLRHAAQKADAVLSKWLAHQYGPYEQYIVLRDARDALRHALQ